MFEILRIIFDRRHVKDLRLWVLLMLFIGFCAYHWLVIKPIQEKQRRHGQKQRAIVSVLGIEKKVEKEMKEQGRDAT